MDLVLPGELGGWTWLLAWSGAGEKARRPGCNQNVIIVILFFLFLVNFPLVLGLFFSLVTSYYLSKSMLIQNRKHGL